MPPSCLVPLANPLKELQTASFEHQGCKEKFHEKNMWYITQWCIIPIEATAAFLQRLNQGRFPTYILIEMSLTHADASKMVSPIWNALLNWSSLPFDGFFYYFSNVQRPVKNKKGKLTRARTQARARATNSARHSTVELAFWPLQFTKTTKFTSKTNHDRHEIGLLHKIHPS